MCMCLNIPRCSHRLIQQTISGLIINKFQFYGIKVKRTIQTKGYGTHIHDRSGTETITFIQGKRLTSLYALDKVGNLWLRFGIIG